MAISEYERGVEAARAVFDKMWRSGDWEGQVSIGFASVYDQEVDAIIWGERAWGGDDVVL